MVLFDLFKPSHNMSENIAYHLRNELEYRELMELIEHDQCFLECYSKLAEVKYHGYRPVVLKEG